MLPADVGVISDRISFRTQVIPAKAGIQSVNSALPKVREVDSRFRGNDRDLQCLRLANVAFTCLLNPAKVNYSPGASRSVTKFGRDAVWRTGSESKIKQHNSFVTRSGVD